MRSPSEMIPETGNEIHSSLTSMVVYFVEPFGLVRFCRLQPFVLKPASFAVVE